MTVGLLDRVSRLFSGGDDELGRDDLLRRTADAILTLRRYGARGVEVFPAEVLVTITVGEGALTTLRAFLDAPEFDAEVEGRLRNALDDPRARLPVRRYGLAGSDRTSVTAVEAEPRGGLALRISGGDRDGARLLLPPGRLELRFGRGEWHGAGRKLRNDFVLSESDEFVSRRAGRIHVVGTSLQIEALDQGEFLCIHRQSGERVRPAGTASGRTLARPGDVIVLDDGRGRELRVTIEEGV